MLKEKTAAPPLHLPTPLTISLSFERVACGILHLIDPLSKRWVNPPETRQLLLTASCPVRELATPLLERHELPESNRAFELKRTLQRFQNPSPSCAPTE
jgi:hypothetical protein